MAWQVTITDQAALPHAGNGKVLVRPSSWASPLMLDDVQLAAYRGDPVSCPDIDIIQSVQANVSMLVDDLPLTFDPVTQMSIDMLSGTYSYATATSDNDVQLTYAFTPLRQHPHIILQSVSVTLQSSHASVKLQHQLSAPVAATGAQFNSSLISHPFLTAPMYVVHGSCTSPMQLHLLGTSTKYTFDPLPS